MIDPNSAKLDLKAQKVLHQLFNQNVNEGKLTIHFADPGFSLKGSAEFTLQETGQNYTCSYEGCLLNLAGGTYHLLLADSYQLDNQAHQSYRVKGSISSISFQIIEGQNNELTLSLEGEQTGPQPASMIDYKMTLLDEKGKPVNSQTIAGAIQFHSTLNNQETSNCVVEQGHCTTLIYNQHINSKTGRFGTENYQIEHPNTVQYLEKTYTLVSEKTDKKLLLPANSSEITLNAFYQAGTTPSQNCTVHLALQNHWEGGAVFQGTLTNTTKEPIHNFSFKLSFNSHEMTNPMIVNHWLGNNASLLESNGVFTLSAQPSDMSNGLLPGKTQSIGFQIAGSFLQKPVINVLSCDAE
ncbi:cellulose binding domain-containing protein [Legionella tunisiensis]|uniref:cellulose binding domain-containing protein n=1 Tax=Legionella tunisiensis TaxID=1034944 RepID=UPI0002E8E24A|nr:cellulose binding domain-containing protein [Legionella tunisiensis]